MLLFLHHVYFKKIFIWDLTCDSQTVCSVCCWIAEFVCDLKRCTLSYVMKSERDRSLFSSCQFSNIPALIFPSARWALACWAFKWAFTSIWAADSRQEGTNIEKNVRDGKKQSHAERGRKEKKDLRSDRGHVRETEGWWQAELRESLQEK